tara:strand:- start:14263 stop:15168 length:906 start_codon:yes stop_codon:yes gene_type:complete
MKLIKEGIYRINRDIINSVSIKKINKLKKSADEVSRLRSRVLYHSSTNSNPQHMFICFSAKSIVEVSMHTFAESFLINSGVAQYRFYKKNGNTFHDIRMSSASMKGNFYAFIAPHIPHRFFPISDYVLANEVGHSSFLKENTYYGSKQKFEKANNINSEEIASQPIVKSSVTTFIKENSNLYTFYSKTGIAELSFDAVNDLALKVKKSFCLMPNLKMLKNRKSNKQAEKFYVITGNDQIEIYLQNSIIHSIYGDATITVNRSNQQINPSKLFVLGPLKNQKVKIANKKKEIAIIHVTTEKK